MYTHVYHILEQLLLYMIQSPYSRTPMTAMPLRARTGTPYQHLYRPWNYSARYRYSTRAPL